MCLQSDPPVTQFAGGIRQVGAKKTLKSTVTRRLERPAGLANPSFPRFPHTECGTKTVRLNCDLARRAAPSIGAQNLSLWILADERLIDDIVVKSPQSLNLEIVSETSETYTYRVQSFIFYHPVAVHQRTLDILHEINLKHDTTPYSLPVIARYRSSYRQ